MDVTCRLVSYGYQVLVESLGEGLNSTSNVLHGANFTSD